MTTIINLVTIHHHSCSFFSAVTNMLGYYYYSSHLHFPTSPPPHLAQPRSRSPRIAQMPPGRQGRGDGGSHHSEGAGPGPQDSMSPPGTLWQACGSWVHNAQAAWALIQGLELQHQPALGAGIAWPGVSSPGCQSRMC